MSVKPNNKVVNRKTSAATGFPYFKRLKAIKSIWGFNPVYLTIFILIFGGGGLYIILSHAAPPPPTIYLTPAAGSYKSGATFSVQVRENSGPTGINAVQSNFTYPSNLVTCTSIDDTSDPTSGFGVQAQSTCNAGQVTIARGVAGGNAALTGDQLVATIHFTVGTTGGSAAMSFTSGTALVSAATNQDILGSLGATAGGTYIVDVTAPTINVSAPTAGASVGGSAVIVSATASDNIGVVGVQFKLDGSNLGAEDTSSSYSTSWDTTSATNGGHTLTAVARDAAGNSTTSTAISITVDNSAPTVSISAPANGAYIAGSSVALSAIATDNVGVVGVQFKLDGTNIGAEDTTSPYTISWNSTTVSAGGHSITAIARDAAGNSTTSSIVAITIDNTAPTVSVSAPVNGSFVGGSIVTVNAAAADNIGVAGVQFKLDGMNLGAEDTTTPFSISWNTTSIANGSHVLTAVARDNAGNMTTSATSTVSVDNGLPTVSVTAPVANSTLTGSVSINATASDNSGGPGISKVEFYVDTTLVGSSLTAPYSYTWDTSTSTNGTHVITARAYDKTTPANTATSTGIPVTLIVPDNQPPTKPGNFSVAGTTTTSVTLSWTASTDNVGVTGYRVLRNGNLVATTTSLGYMDTGLSSSTSYSYTVVATDAASNVSPPAGPINGSTLAIIPGDDNGDGHVNVVDLSVLLSNYGTAYGPSDFNNDGIVNVVDLSILLTNYGR